MIRTHVRGSHGEFWRKDEKDSRDNGVCHTKQIRSPTQRTRHREGPRWQHLPSATEVDGDRDSVTDAESHDGCGYEGVESGTGADHEQPEQQCQNSRQKQRVERLSEAFVYFGEEP
jgi:hypothetical protein